MHTVLITFRQCFPILYFNMYHFIKLLTWCYFCYVFARFLNIVSTPSIILGCKILISVPFSITRNNIFLLKKIVWLKYVYGFGLASTSMIFQTWIFIYVPDKKWFHLIKMNFSFHSCKINQNMAKSLYYMFKFQRPFDL